MVPSLLRRFFTRFGEQRTRRIFLAGFVLLLLGISQIVRIVWIDHLQGGWEAIQERRAQEDAAIAVREFAELQNAAERVSLGVAQHQDVREYLGGMRNERRALFAAVMEAADANGCGVEVYDAEGELVSWAGPGGPPAIIQVRSALLGHTLSAVVRTAVTSQLVVVSPVRSTTRVIGVAIARQTVEVDYPLSNRFMAYVGLADRLTSRLGTVVEFDFSENAAARKDGRWLCAPLASIDGKPIGMVSLMRPSRLAAIENLQTAFASFDISLVIIFCGLTLFPVALWFWKRRGTWGGAVGLVSCMWLTRYLLLWLGFPDRFISGSVFNPTLFASEFGGGLAQSIGDLFLTVVAFVFSLAALTRITAMRSEGRTAPSGFLPDLGRSVGAIVVTFLLFWMLRGYGAIIRSAVVDSTLSYGDPGIILPPLPMAVMLISLGLLSVCMVALGERMTERLFALLGGWHVGPVRTLLLFVLASVLFGSHQDEPLMSTTFRLGCSAVFIGMALWRRGPREAGDRRKRGTLTVAYVATAVCLLVPLLQRNIEEQAKSRIEAFAVEFVRPVDGWLKVIVEDGLRQLGDASTGHGEMLKAGADSVKDAPLRAWARSTACREGYSALFAILDSAGAVRGKFSIGSQSSLITQFAEALPLDSTGMVRIKSIGDGITAVRVYGGTTFLRDASGGTPGFARVVIAAGEQQLFRGDNPAVLRGSAGEPVESYSRTITLSEYRDGLLVRTSNMAIPYTQVLSDEVRTALNRPETPAVWTKETIAGAKYDSYAIRKGNDSHDVIVLSTEHQRLLMALVGLSKVPLVFVLALLAGAGVYVVFRGRHGAGYVFTFRDRLLAAMLLTAFVPLVALLLYGRYSVHNRAKESLSSRLEQETASIAQEIAGIGEYSDASLELSLRPDRVEFIASNVGTDFNLYVGSELRVSSRPELYTTGFIDSRLNGKAYAAVVLEGRRFAMESEHVGLYQYEVGYRPVLDAAGGVIGIVGVPMLYRQEDVARELSEQNAVLIGVYAIVLLAIVIATMVLANRIAAPVQKLTILTRDLARGELDISARLPKAEGEIGELVKSFGAMARDLRSSRDELVRVERELAWREMARQIAHEIKNPLTPMKLSIQHLRQTYLDKAPDFDAILEKVSRTIIDQIDTLGRIASEFSNFARMPRRRIESCDLPEVVQEAVQLFRQDRQIAFHVEADDGIPPLQADRDELRRAFINIIRNGVQATTGPGRIDVSLRKTPDGVRIAFRDHGCGIADEVRPKLFQPNFSTKTDGMGLGLAIVKKTMDDLGARIAIESSPGAGTTVILEIPIARESAS
jgi:two-component system, NtrC family, nitrogen regulation sensor histidine kinase NtrY